MDIDSDDNYIPSQSDLDEHPEGQHLLSARERPVVPIIKGEPGTGFSPINTPSLTSPRPAQRRLKRRGSALEISAPLKRQKGTLNVEYLDLLNQDIQDAAANSVVENGPHLHSSQNGLTRWSRAEKEALFSALGRLGRDNLPGIAARIGSKGPLEVRQYLVLLCREDRKRREDRVLSRYNVTLDDIPAAVEVSQECCNALEATADDASLRQEGYEISVEERRWGDVTWIVAVNSLPSLEADTRETGTEHPAFAEFFHCRQWLKLSRSVFMNSSLEEYNWRSYSDDSPSIWSTTMSDFHALTISITKRLVAATLYMAASRLKAKLAVRSKTKLVVRDADVRAAVDSLGMKSNSCEFWAGAARRLRLDVYDDTELSSEDNAEMTDEDLAEAEDNDSQNEEEESMQSAGEEASGESGSEPMSYSEVETALGISKAHDETAETTTTPEPSSSEPESSDELLAEDGFQPNQTTSHAADSDYQEDSGADSGDQDDEIDMEGEEEDGDDDDDDDDGDDDDDEISRMIDADAVNTDLKEATLYSAEFDGTARGRNAIKARIRAEHRREIVADMHDARSSAAEEARLWAVVRRLPGPVSTAPGGETGSTGDVKMQDGKREDKQGHGSGTRRRWGYRDSGPVDWRANVRYVSAWETETRGGST